MGVGAKWGLVAGIVVGAVAAAINYYSVKMVEDLILGPVYRVATFMGASESEARAIVEEMRAGFEYGVVLFHLIFHVVLYLVLGVVMAAPWGVPRLPWHTKGPPSP